MASPDETGQHRPEDHGDRCYCGRPATKHVYYVSGCGNVCGIHRNTIERRSVCRVESRERPILVAR